MLSSLERHVNHECFIVISAKQFQGCILLASVGKANEVKVI